MYVDDCFLQSITKTTSKQIQQFKLTQNLKSLLSNISTESWLCYLKGIKAIVNNQKLHGYIETTHKLGSDIQCSIDGVIFLARIKYFLALKSQTTQKFMLAACINKFQIIVDNNEHDSLYKLCTEESFVLSQHINGIAHMYHACSYHSCQLNDVTVSYTKAKKKEKMYFDKGTFKHDYCNNMQYYCNKCI